MASTVPGPGTSRNACHLLPVLLTPLGPHVVSLTRWEVGEERGDTRRVTGHLSNEVQTYKNDSQSPHSPKRSLQPTLGKLGEIYNRSIQHRRWEREEGVRAEWLDQRRGFALTQESGSPIAREECQKKTGMAGISKPAVPGGLFSVWTAAHTSYCHFPLPVFILPFEHYVCSLFLEYIGLGAL